LQAIKKPEELYDTVVEVEERLVVQREDCQLPNGHKVLTGTTGEKVRLFGASVDDDNIFFFHPTLGTFILSPQEKRPSL
jgi:hypothetical protein